MAFLPLHSVLCFCFWPRTAKQEGPDGLPSDVASARLPAASIPAILSVFIDATSARMWRAPPAVRPGMSMLDLERWWHLKDRVGVDVSVGVLQVKYIYEVYIYLFLVCGSVSRHYGLKVRRCGSQEGGPVFEVYSTT